MQNNNWCFGQRGGFSFSTGRTYNSSVFSIENCASVSDRTTGKLLFYTDGKHVYDSTHAVMQEGAGVGDDIIGTSAQGSLIVPFPLDSNKYYLFTLDHWASYKSYLKYSVIDMTLNGGNGAVVLGQKAIIIDSNLTEAMTAINSCSQTWIATVKKGTNDFNMILVSPAGVSSARVVSSKSHPYFGKGLITARFSPDVRKIVTTIGNGVNTESYVALYDFDVSTGKVSNGIIIDTVFNREEFYGCEFSPDSKKLFVDAVIAKAIYQYNLEYTDAATIRASRKTIVQSGATTYGSPQIGPDNNIYFTELGSQYLQKIVNPNAMSPGCIYQPNAILLSGSAVSRYTLPQAIRLLTEKPYIRGGQKDTVICNSRYTIHADKNHVSYLWNDNTTADTLFITQSGRYTVKITDSCFDYTDTFNITLEPALSLDLGPDTAVCAGKAVTLKNRLASQGIPLWSTGSTLQSVQVRSPGTYSLTLTYNTCKLTDTINIYAAPQPVVHLRDDTAVCQYDSILIAPNAQPPGSTYAWSTGETTAAIYTARKGYIYLTVNNNDCVTSDTVLVRNIPQPYIDLGDDTLMCYGKTITLPHALFASDSTSFEWNDGSTKPRLTLYDNKFVKVKMSNVCGLFTDSVNVTFRVCEVWLPTAFSPNGDGLNDYFHMLGDVKNVGFFRMLVYNRWGQCVFSSDDVRNGWDGKLKGKDAEAGTYCYMIKLVYNGLGSALSQMWKGDITLIR